MKTKRACEIVNSPAMANVTYYDVPVYIESVSQGNKTAMIHQLNTPGRSQRVSVSNLVERI